MVPWQHSTTRVWITRPCRLSSFLSDTFHIVSISQETQPLGTFKLTGDPLESLVVSKELIPEMRSWWLWLRCFPWCAIVLKSRVSKSLFFKCPWYWGSVFRQAFYTKEAQKMFKRQHERGVFWAAASLTMVTFWFNFFLFCNYSTNAKYIYFFKSQPISL